MDIFKSELLPILCAFAIQMSTPKQVDKGAVTPSAAVLKCL